MNKLSIVIPTYNAEKTIVNCIGSIFQNIRCAYEVIIIDDASDDNTEKVIKELNISNIKYIKNNNNKGAGASRNIGLREANGEYIWFVDSDDEITGDVESALHYIKRDNLDVLFFDMTICNHSAIMETRYIDPSDKYINGTGVNLLDSFLKKGQVAQSACRQIYSRSFLIDNSIYFPEGTINEDAVFTFEVFLRAKKAGYYHCSLYKYIRRINSVSSYPNERFITSCISNLYKMLKIIQSANKEDMSISFYLQNYITQIRDRLSNSNIDLIREYYEKTSDNNERMIFNVLFDTRGDERQISEKCINAIKNADKVLIYGAGKYGKLVARIASSYDKEIVEFAVSDKKSSEESRTILGHKVNLIDYYRNIVDDACIIIAVGRPYQNEIKDRLKMLGFNEGVTVDA